MKKFILIAGLLLVASMLLLLALFPELVELVTWLPNGWTEIIYRYEVLFRGLVGGVSAILFLFAIIFILRGIIRGIKNLGLYAIEKAKPKIESTIKETKRNYEKITRSDKDRVLEIEDIFYEQASKELEQNTENKGLWIKVGIIADGNLEKQKSEYIKQRAKQLNEEKSKLKN